MRDTSTAAQTGYLRHGNFFQRMGGRIHPSGRYLPAKERLARVRIKTFSRPAQSFINSAMADPDAKPDVVTMLVGPDPYERIARRASIDAIAAANPKPGDRIIFKQYAQYMGPRVHAAQSAIRREMEDPSPQFVGSVLQAPKADRGEAAGLYLSMVGIEAFAPGTINYLDDQDELMVLGAGSPLGGWLKKVAKKMTEGTAGKVTGWMMGPGVKTAIRNISKGQGLGRKILNFVDPVGTNFYQKKYEEPKAEAKAAEKAAEAEAVAVQQQYEQELRSAYGLDQPLPGSPMTPYTPPEARYLPPEEQMMMERMGPPPPAAEEEGGVLPWIAAAGAGVVALYAMS
jgi:hypothetical protein